MLSLPKLDAHQSWADAATDPRARGEVADALADFRRMLGEDWPGWAAAYPLASQFFVDFQHRPPECVRLWRMVQVLRRAPGLDDVVKSGLGGKQWSDYLAAVMGL